MNCDECEELLADFSRFEIKEQHKAAGCWLQQHLVNCRTRLQSADWRFSKPRAKALASAAEYEAREDSKRNLPTISEIRSQSIVDDVMQALDRDACAKKSAIETIAEGKPLGKRARAMKRALKIIHEVRHTKYA